MPHRQSQHQLARHLDQATGPVDPRRDKVPPQANRWAKLAWHCREDLDLEFLQDQQWQWLNLAEHRGAQLIKQNAHRQVWRIRAGQRQFYAKLYLRSGKWWWLKSLFRCPTCMKEWQVQQYAVKHQVACVKPMAYALNVNNHRDQLLDCLLITESAEDVVPLTSYWLKLQQTLPEAQCHAALTTLQDALAELLAKAHQENILHTDLHPGNLLVRASDSTSRPEVLFVDLQNVRTGSVVTERQAVANLAQLNQWFRKHATVTRRLRLLKKYVHYRRLFAGQSPSNKRYDFKHWAVALDIASTRHALKLWASRDRRAMRSSKYFAKFKLPDHWQTHVFLKSKHPIEFSPTSQMSFTVQQWSQTLAEPLTLLKQIQRTGSVLKNSRSTKVCSGQLMFNGLAVSVVTKRQIRRKKLAVIWDCLRPSRALRAWKLSSSILHRGLPVPLPLAVLERRIGPYLADSILITEQIKPAVNLKTFWTTGLGTICTQRQRQVKLILIEQLAGLLRKMHQMGFVHRDLKATNILLKNPPSQGETSPKLSKMKFVLVDLDGLSLKTSVTAADRLRALVRLSISAQETRHISRTDRLRFLRAYLTSYGSGLPKWKNLWRQIEKLSAKY